MSPGWSTLAVIIALALAIKFIVQPMLPRPPTGMFVGQWRNPGTNQWCHVARLYYDGNLWRCV